QFCHRDELGRCQGKVAKVNAELAADPAKATSEDGPKFQYYLNNMQKAIMTYQSALSTANTYTVAMGQVCKVNDAAEAATRLYAEMNPMASSKFHLPSALLGYGRLPHHKGLTFSGILDGRGYFGVKTPAAKACVRFRATFGLRHLTGWWQSGSSIRVATTTVARSFQVRQQSLEILKTELLCVCAS
ncbi:unnamed protein product, partial [Symbiodinium necroappetens]